MTPLEHQQIAEVNAQWRSMNKPKDIEAAKSDALKEYQKQRYAEGISPSSGSFLLGFNAAIAYLSEPGAMRFLANESITKENEGLKKRIAELEQELGSRLKVFVAESREAK